MGQSVQSKQKLQPLLAAVNKTLERMRLDDAGWDLMPEFLEQVQEKVSTREVQLAAQLAEEAEHRAALNEELEILCQETSTLLDFFEFNLCGAEWKLDEVSFDDLRIALEQARLLFHNLQQYQELEQAAQTAESVVTKRDIRSQILKQEDQILQLVSTLKSILPLAEREESAAAEDEPREKIAHIEDNGATSASENANEVDTVPEAEELEETIQETDVSPSADELSLGEDLAMDFAKDEIGKSDETNDFETPPHALLIADSSSSVVVEATEEADLENENGNAFPSATAEVVKTGKEGGGQAASQKIVSETAKLADDRKEKVVLKSTATIPPVSPVRKPAPEKSSKPPLKTKKTPLAKSPLRNIADWTSLFWQLVLKGDIAGAYWLNRSLSMPENNMLLPVSDWLVAAVQGAWWLSGTRGMLVQDLAHLAFGKTVGNTPNEKFLANSAALLPTLIAPSTGLGTWLETDKRLPEAFNNIITAVREFNFHGRTLRRNDVLIISGKDNRQQILDELQKTAKRWLEEAPQRRAPILKRASDVWYSWTRPNGDLRRMVEIVANNAVNRDTQLEAFINEWQALTVSEQINQTDAKNLGTKRSRNPMVGPPRNWLINQSEESLQLVEEWLELVRSDDDRAGWFLKQVESLLHNIKIEKDKAFQQLLSLEKSTSGEISPASIRLLIWALIDLCRFLELDVPEEEHFPHQIPLYNFPVGVEPGLYSGLQFRLFWIPEVELNSNLDLPPQKINEIAEIIYQTHERRSLTHAFEIFLERHDYRFIPIILQNETEVDETKYRESLGRSKQLLGRQLQEVENLVEQAVLEGVIDDDGRSGYESELVEVEQKEKEQNYGTLLDKLQDIKNEVDEQRVRHLEHQQERWSEIDKRLQEKKIGKKVSQSIAHYMNDSIGKGDLIVTDERLARLEEILDSGGVPEQDEFLVNPERDVYREFVNGLTYWENKFHNINLQQTARNLASGSYDQVLQFEYTLPKPREIEVVDAFRKWSDLKKTAPNNRAVVIESVITVMQYLSFTFLKKPSHSITWKRNERDWAYLSVEMSGGNLSPVPQFGSQQPNGFDVICLWERPGAELIGSRLHNLKLSFNNVIVLYLGRLTKLHRIRLQQYTREQSLSLAVLDELLLLFLARETDSRLGSFLRCSLPLASVNPYAETGPVYPEMFFGRVEERKSLQEPAGYALVHGGRQLGKSALLQQVEREFHSPGNDRHVYREDIKFIGDPASRQSDPDLLWEHLRRGLENIHLLSESSASKPETVISKIKQMMAQNPSRRVLVLFDEADNFLAADMERNFETVSKLKALMDDTQRRFKVIFAGLHIVQRYEGIPNQPLAHLPNLLVRPLEPQSAIQLIRQPFEALGFRFPEEDYTPLLGILAYTNYHPGLIQLFCQKLLIKMYQERPRDIGPFIITRDHVEAVYRQQEVRDGIRRRFEWTLALDERYKVLTQLMVLDQIEVKDGFSATYTVDELSVMASSYWPQAFENSSRAAFKGYLDEMAGLGVLVRNQNGDYRLRSPNLVRLLGSIDDLWGSLAEVTSKSISSSLVGDSHHAPLDNQAKRYSPFTYQQSRVLNAKRYGVGLIFGSQALNVDYVENALKDHFVPQGGSGKVKSLHLSVDRGDALSQWLATILEQNTDQERLILYQHMQGTPKIMAEQVETAVKFCARRQRSQRQWVRILLIFNSDATRRWLSLPIGERIAIEEQVDALVTLHPWDEIGIAQRLTQHDKIGSEQTVNQIIKNLGGWPILIDQLTDNWGKSNDPLPTCNEILQELLKPQSNAASKFLAATGWDLNEKIKQVLQAIAREELGVPSDMLVPVILGENLTENDCKTIAEYGARMNLLHQRGTEVVVEALFRQIILNNES